MCNIMIVYRISRYEISYCDMIRMKFLYRDILVHCITCPLATCYNVVHK